MLFLNAPKTGRDYLRQYDERTNQERPPNLLNISGRFGANRMKMPLEAAYSITDSPQSYPSFLVALAESQCRDEVVKHIKPVAAVAERDGWLAD